MEDETESETEDKGRTDGWMDAGRTNRSWRRTNGRRTEDRIEGRGANTVDAVMQMLLIDIDSFMKM